MAQYVSRLDDGDETKLRGLGNTAASGDGSSNGTFFRAVLLVRNGKVSFILDFYSLIGVDNYMAKVYCFDMIFQGTSCMFSTFVYNANNSLSLIRYQTQLSVWNLSS